uniref:Uncharacterized protein n=1 Tax=Spiroplasma citri TaxID=2133 RepID=Q14PU9_SPICI|nr:hypothetical protein SPICI03_015 [Spiroplasma citri]
MNNIVQNVSFPFAIKGNDFKEFDYCINCGDEFSFNRCITCGWKTMIDLKDNSKYDKLPSKDVK